MLGLLDWMSRMHIQLLRPKSIETTEGGCSSRIKGPLYHSPILFFQDFKLRKDS